MKLSPVCLNTVNETTKLNPITHGIYARATQVIQLIFHARGVLSAVICGESGTGKSTLCAEFRQQHPPVEGLEGVTLPVVYLVTPTRPTAKTFARAFLFAMGAEPIGNPSAEQLKEQVVTLLRGCKTRVVIIDEVQHYIDRRGQDAVAEMADWLKVIMDQAQISVILVGLPRTVLLLKSNEQLRRRINIHHQLNAFEITTSIGQRELLNYLRSLEKILPFTKPQKLASAELLLPIWYASNGLVDYINKLVSYAGDIALESGEETLTRNHLAQAFNELIWPGAKNENNPFHEDFRPRPLTSPNEPFAPVIPKRVKEIH